MAVLFCCIANVRFWAVGSIGRCNTSIKSFGSGFEAQSLARPFVELPSHSVELRMRAASGPLLLLLGHRVETSNVSSTHRYPLHLLRLR